MQYMLLSVDLIFDYILFLLIIFLIRVVNEAQRNSMNLVKNTLFNVGLLHCFEKKSVAAQFQI